MYFYFEMLIKLDSFICSLSVEMAAVAIAVDVHCSIFEQLSYFNVTTTDDFANLGGDEVLEIERTPLPLLSTTIKQFLHPYVFALANRVPLSPQMLYYC